MTEIFVDPKTKSTFVSWVFMAMNRTAKTATIPTRTSFAVDAAPRPALFGWVFELGTGVGCVSVTPTRAYATAPAATVATGTSLGAGCGMSRNALGRNVGQICSGRIAQSPPRRK